MFSLMRPKALAKNLKDDMFKRPHLLDTTLLSSWIVSSHVQLFTSMFKAISASERTAWPPKATF